MQKTNNETIREVFTMYELMLDTANLKELENGMAAWPISGVTTNPSILSKQGKIDIGAHIDAIKSMSSSERTLHVQVDSATTEEIIREAHAMVDRFGEDLYIKIPVSAAGLPAIKTLATEGLHVSATSIYTSMQCMLAALAGAEYLIFYYNRMVNCDIDACTVIRDVRAFLDGSGSKARLLGASFKNVKQVTDSFAAGAHGATVPASIITDALGMASVNAAVDAFTRDFENVHGTGATMLGL